MRAQRLLFYKAVRRPYVYIGESIQEGVWVGNRLLNKKGGISGLKILMAHLVTRGNRESEGLSPRPRFGALRLPMEKSHLREGSRPGRFLRRQLWWKMMLLPMRDLVLIGLL